MRQKNHTFPIIIGVFSLLTIYKIVFHPLDIFGIASVIVGMTGVALYYKDSRKYDGFFYAWVLMQLPNIFLINNFGLATPIINAFPSSIIPVNLGVGLNFGLKGDNNLTIYLNLLPIGLYFLLNYLNADKPLGAKVSIARLRKGTFPQIQFPVTGTIEKIAGRKKTTAVYTIRLDNEIVIKDKSHSYIMLDPKDNSLIQLTDKRQICGLRICEQPDFGYSHKQNPFVDWVTIEAK